MKKYYYWVIAALLIGAMIITYTFTTTNVDVEEETIEEVEEI